MIKDYYSILGLSPSADLEDIKKAYRKLSIKFHPDKNSGDDYFTERFKEVLEAYEILSNQDEKKKYDSILKKQQNNANEKINNFDPIIEYFEADKIEVDYLESVEVKWNTRNADQVSIDILGQVNPVGSMSYVMNVFDVANIKLVLIARNNYTGVEITKELNIKNGTFTKLKNRIFNEYHKRILKISIFILLILVFLLSGNLIIKKTNENNKKTEVKWVNNFKAVAKDTDRRYVYASSFPGIPNFRLPNLEDITPETGWYYWGFKSFNPVDTNRLILPFYIEEDLNGDSHLDRACLLINEDNSESGILCVYLRNKAGNYDAYIINEYHYVKNILLDRVQKGETMCNYKENKELETFNNCIVAIPHESSMALFFEYDNQRDRFYYGRPGYRCEQGEDKN